MASEEPRAGAPTGEMTADERARWIEEVARRVADKQLETVAVLFLEMHRPLAFLGSQALLVAAPMLGTLFGFENMQRVALFIQSPENIEALVRRIEALARERNTAPEGSR